MPECCALTVAAVFDGLRHAGFALGRDWNFYERFKAELDKVEITGSMPAAAVVGECLRAAKRAQMALDGTTQSDGSSDA